MPRPRKYRDAAERKRAQRAKDAANGKRQLNLELSRAAREALEAIQEQTGLPRTVIIEAALQDQLKSVRRKRAKARSDTASQKSLFPVPKR